MEPAKYDIVGVPGRRCMLSVVLCAGLPREKVTHVREVAVLIHYISQQEIKEAVLEVFDGDGSDARLLARLPVRDHIDERYQDSIRVLTGLVFDQTRWASNDLPASSSLGYRAVVRPSGGGPPFASGSLRAQPCWMQQMPAATGRLSLYELAVPGTHNSGAYSRSTSSRVGRYRDCQEEDVFTQLLYGVRALDLRPAAKKKATSPYNGYDYWIYHDRFPTKNRLDTVLTDVRRFLDIFNKEVVFIDFHEFPVGFKKHAAFDGLARLVNDTLGDYVLQRDQFSPIYVQLSRVITMNKRAIVTYDKDTELRKRFLPGVRHIWANTDKLEKLREFIEEHQTKWRPGGWFFSAMSQLTPQGIWMVIRDKYRGGVRGLAHRNNFQITQWYRYNEAMRTNANIISMDFVVSTDIVDLCREINIERAVAL